MKKSINLLLLVLLSLSSTIALAQAPLYFNYQGIARDTFGHPLASKNLGIRISVLPDPDASPRFIEEHSVSTNNFGLYTLRIGAGQVVAGSMHAVDWPSGQQYIQVEIDATGGRNYSAAGTTQLLSVPYALYANESGTNKTRAGNQHYLSKFDASGSSSAEINSQLYDNGTNIGIGTTTPAAKFHVNQNVAAVQEHLRMQNQSATGAGRFTMYSDAATNYATFTKYGSTFAGGYAGIPALYPYANLLAFGNNGLAAGDGLGRFLISSGGNIGISLFKSGISKLKFHADFSSENVGIGGSATPVSRVHLNNTDGTNLDLRLTNTTSGHTATDGLLIGENGTNGSVMNQENGSLSLGTNNLPRVVIAAGGNVDFSNQIKITGGNPGAGKVLTSDATGLASWQTPAAGGGTLDQAYDNGGPGNGRIITADSGAVFIQGTDGLQVTGNYGFGKPLGLSGPGSKMFYFPKKGAFRSGTVNTNFWDEDSLGIYSFSSGFDTKATGSGATAMGVATSAQGQGGAAIGQYAEAKGNEGAVAIGNSTIAQAQSSVALGMYNDPMASSNPNASVPTDPILLVGNGSSNLNRSNALTILKNGNIGLGENAPAEKLVVNGQVRITGGTPGAGKVLTSDAAGTASWQFIPSTLFGATTLDSAYDYGGPGLGRVIQATHGAVYINGPDGLHVNDSVGIGTTSPAARLDVAGTVKISGGNPGLGKVLTSDANGLASWQTVSGGSANLNGTTNQLIRFNSSNSGINSQIFDDSLRVGIGTTSPRGKLHVRGSAVSDTVKFTNASTGNLATDGYDIRLTNQEVIHMNRESAAMKFGVKDSVYMTMDSVGRIGIRSTPTYPLQVENNQYSYTSYFSNTYPLPNAPTVTGYFINSNPDSTGGAVAIFAGTNSGRGNPIQTSISGSNTANQTSILNFNSHIGVGRHTSVSNIVSVGLGEVYGIRNQINSAGTLAHVGVWDSLYGMGSGEFSVRKSYITNTGNGNHYGTDQSFSGLGSGAHVGMINRFSQGSGHLTGAWNEFAGFITNGNQIGVFNNHFVGGTGLTSGMTTWIQGSNSGNGPHFGMQLEDNSTGNGNHYGVYHILAGPGDGEQTGVYNNISNSGDSLHYGMINLLSGSGNNYHTGVFSKFTNGGGNLTGKWNEFSGTIGNGNHIGVFNNFFTGGNGIQAGLYTWMNSGMTGTGVQYGTYAANSSSGSGSSFGSYNFLGGTGTGPKTGQYVWINSNNDTTHKGVEVVLTGTGNGTKIGQLTDVTVNGTGSSVSQAIALNVFSATNANPQTGQSITVTSNHNAMATGQNIVMNSTGTSTSIGSNVFYTSSATSNATQYGYYSQNTSGGSGTHVGGAHLLSGSANGAMYGTDNRVNNNGTGLHYGTYNLMSGTGKSLNYGTYNRITNSGDSTHYGSFNSVENTGDGTHYGTYNELKGTNTGIQYGTYNTINSVNDTMQIGTYNGISNSGDGYHYGVQNVLTTAGTGPTYGITNSINVTNSLNNSLHFGMNNLLFNNGPGNITGANAILTNTGTGNEYGFSVYHQPTSTGGGLHAGVSNFDVSPGGGTHYGFYNEIGSTGSGNAIGFYSQITNTGSGTHKGIELEHTGAGGGTKYGIQNTMGGNSSGLIYGLYNMISNNSTSTKYGVYNEFSGTGTATNYGVYNEMGSTGNGIQYGVYNFISSTATGTGSKYGNRVFISPSAGGTQYGFYADVQKAGSYAGYFVGDVRVGGELEPTVNSTSSATGFSLGSSTLRWRDAYVWRGSFNGSDIRLKTNIDTLRYGLQEVLAMRTIKYNWKSEPQGNKEIGLVAQQIKELIPEVVETARDSMGTLMMNYSALIPVLVNAIREQQTQIESLKKEKAGLQDTVQSNEARLDALEARLQELTGIPLTPSAPVKKGVSEE